MNDKPCKKCGHCPTCGRGGVTATPWRQPFYPTYPQPIWVEPRYIPGYPYGTTYGGSNTSISSSSLNAR